MVTGRNTIHKAQRTWEDVGEVTMEARLLEDRPWDELLREFAIFEDLSKPAERRKSPNGIIRERFHPPFNRKFGLLPVLHTLKVRDVLASANDGYFTFPYNLHGRVDRPVDARLGVPVAGN